MMLGKSKQPSTLWISASLLALALSSSGPAHAEGASSMVTLNPSGGALPDASDGLRWDVGSNAQFQVHLGNQSQVYNSDATPMSGSIFNGLALRVDKTLADNSTQVTVWKSFDRGAGKYFDQGTQSALQGSGTPGDPWRVVSELNATLDGSTIKLTVTDSYAAPQLWLTRQITVGNLPVSVDVSKIRLYQNIDTYLQGGDEGPGFTRTSPGNTSSVPDYVGVIKSEQIETLIADSPQWDLYYTGHYDGPAGLIAGSGDLDNTVNTNEATDNGIAVQWSIPPGNSSFSVQYRIAFSNAGVDLTKAFSPSQIKPGGVSTLVFDLANRDYISEATGLGFTDQLPAGLVVAPTPNIQSSCPTGSSMGAQMPVGAQVDAVAGSTSVTVSGFSTNQAPAIGQETKCQISVDVTAAQPGMYHNTTNSIVNTTNLTNMVTDVTLEVLQSEITPVGPVPVPVDNPFALLGLGGVLGMIMLRRTRRS